MSEEEEPHSCITHRSFLAWLHVVCKIKLSLQLTANRLGTFQWRNIFNVFFSFFFYNENKLNARVSKSFIYSRYASAVLIKKEKVYTSAHSANFRLEYNLNLIRVETYLARCFRCALPFPSLEPSWSGRVNSSTASGGCSWVEIMLIEFRTDEQSCITKIVAVVCLH